MTLKDDRRTLTADSIDRILATVPPGVDRERLRSDVEGIHSLYCTALLELRSVDRRKKIGALIALAKEFKLGLFGERDILADSVGMQYWWFRSHLNRLIAELENDRPPELVALLNIDQGVSSFENMVGMLADRWRHYVGEKPGYTTTVDKIDQIGNEVRSDFVDFAAAILTELEVYSDGGEPYARKSIANALTKVEKLSLKFDD